MGSMNPVKCPFCGRGKASYIPDGCRFPMCGDCLWVLHDMDLPLEMRLAPVHMRYERYARIWLALTGRPRAIQQTSEVEVTDTIVTPSTKRTGTNVIRTVFQFPGLPLFIAQFLISC